MQHVLPSAEHLLGDVFQNQDAKAVDGFEEQRKSTPSHTKRRRPYQGQLRKTVSNGATAATSFDTLVAMPGWLARGHMAGSAVGEVAFGFSSQGTPTQGPQKDLNRTSNSETLLFQKNGVGREVVGAKQNGRLLHQKFGVEALRLQDHRHVYLAARYRQKELEGLVEGYSHVWNLLPAHGKRH